MPKLRKIPPIDLKDYSEPGCVYFKPYPPQQVAIEMHFCTAMMDRTQALSALASLSKAGLAVWGESFRADLLAITEKL